MAAENEGSRDTMTPARKAKIGALVAGGILLLFLIFQNMEVATTPIRARVFFWTAGLPPIFLVPFVFLLGLLLGYILRRRK
jgi:uncharacterized integral membrane protein